MTQCKDSSLLGNGDRQITLMLSCGLVLLGMLAFTVLAVHFFPYTMDDSYITFRYASNLAAGHGLVFNAGEYPRAEGITSPLYAVILSLAPLTGANVVALSKWVGLLACLLTAGLICVLVYKLSRSLTSICRMSAIMVCCAATAYYLSNPYVVANAVSGMETSLAAMTFAAFLLLVVRMLSSGARPTHLETFCTGLIAILVPMFRPEMGLSVAIILAVTGWMWRETRQPFLRSLAVFLLLGTVYYSLRFFYYGLPFPLPFYIKQGSFGLHGLSYLISYLRHVGFLLLLVLACIAFAFGPHLGERKRSCVYLIAVLAAVGAQLTYYATLHHIMGFGFRYFQPIAVGFVLLAFVGGAILYEVAIQSRLKASFSLPLLFCALIIVSIGSNVLAYRPAHALFIDWYAKGISTVIRIGRSMNVASKGTILRIAINDCGAIPFYSGFSIIDLAGLNNRAIALAGTTEATRNEIREKKPQLVVLVSKKKHPSGKDGIYGWERLSNDDVIKLGYNYAGTMTVGTMPNGDGYHLLVYANGDPLVLAFLDRLALTGVLDLPSVKSHSENDGNGM